MEQTSFADDCIFDEMKSGFKLCGQANASGAFPLGHQPAQQSVDELRKQAKWLRASVIGKCKPFDGGDLDQVTWDKTIKERDLGWISGPYSLLEMEKLMDGQPKATSSSARECSENLLRLLGWQFAEDGRKALPFDSAFTVLGINMDLSQSSGGKVSISNKPDRVKSLLVVF